MTTRKRTTTAIIAAVFALSAVGAAVADEHEDETPEEPTEDVITTIWDDETHILVVTIDDEGAEEGACDTVTAERDEDGVIVEGGLVLYMDLESLHSAGQYSATVTVTLSQL